MYTTFARARVTAARALTLVLVAVMLAVPVTMAHSASARASTDAYCHECFLNEYGALDIDTTKHNLTLSYAHNLTAPNEWICAGDWSTEHSTCNPNEVSRSYSGQFYFGAEVSHFHGAMYTNAHTDF